LHRDSQPPSLLVSLVINFFRYGGGDEWFGAVIAGASGNGYDLNYDDGDFELAVPREWIR
jgi:hypothetical protein